MQILERENVIFWIYRENLGKNEEIKKEYKNPLAGMSKRKKREKLLLQSF